MPLFRRRAWHEPEPERPAWLRLLRGFATAAVGIGLPIGLLLFFLTSSTPRPPEQPDQPSLPARAAADGPADVPLDGAWTLAGEGRSWVGYRVLEEIPRLADKFEAVGRTETVWGEMEISGLTVESAEVRADLRDLTSDREWRDRVIRRRYLESNEHPEAVFRLTEPFGLLSVPSVGERIVVQVDGTLTIRSITRSVRVSLEALRDGERVRIVGTFPVFLPDHDVSPPRISGFRLVEDEAVIELDLSFVRPG